MRVIKELRKNKKITLKQLGKQLDLAESTISLYEHGKRQPDNDTLKKLSAYFDVPIDYILENDNLGMDGLGRALREERIYQTLSVEELAEHLGITEETLNKYEEEDIPMSEYIIEKACDLLGIPFYNFLNKYGLYNEEIPETFNGDADKYEAYKRAVQDFSNPEIELDLKPKSLTNKPATIKIYGKIPAGVSLDSIEDIRGELEIPLDWINGDKEYIALEISDDSMSPKYLNGDIVLIQVADYCETGQDCAIFVNGYDATFKKVIKGDNYITLQSYNPQYPPDTYVGEQTNDIHILGIAKEMRRNI